MHHTECNMPYLLWYYLLCICVTTKAVTSAKKNNKARSSHISHILDLPIWFLVRLGRRRGRGRGDLIPQHLQIKARKCDVRNLWNIPSVLLVFSREMGKHIHSEHFLIDLYGCDSDASIGNRHPLPSFIIRSTDGMISSRTTFLDAAAAPPHHRGNVSSLI